MAPATNFLALSMEKTNHIIVVDGISSRDNDFEISARRIEDFASIHYIVVELWCYVG